MEGEKSFERFYEPQPAPTGPLAWAGWGIGVLALACLCISFCSPYWLQTWSMSENQFHNIGLWEVCFKDYMQFKDDSQEVYSECWWVFNRQTKFYKLREWLTPPWFITCQVLTTGCLMIEIATTILTGLIFLHCCPLVNHEYLQTYGMFASGSMMILVTMVLFVVGIVFGYWVNDRYWLPRPDQNWLSWGFGFMVISMLCALVSGILLFKSAWDVYYELLRREDEYLQQAMDLSAGGVFEMSEFPNDDQLALVRPGYSHAAPGYPSSFPEKVPLDDYPASQVPSYPEETRKPVAESSWSPPPKPGMDYRDSDKPLAAPGFDEPPTYSAHYDQPSGYAIGGQATFDQPSGAVGGKSYDQPSRYGGKSYGKTYDRTFSDSDYNPDDDDIGPSKPERRY